MKAIRELLTKYTGNDISDPQIFWLLIGIDHAYIEQDGLPGIIDFEGREPGCIGAMAKAFLYLLTTATSNERFNILQANTEAAQIALAKKLQEKFRKYHILCTENVVFIHVNRHEVSCIKHIHPGAYRTTRSWFGFYVEDRKRSKANGSAAGHEYLYRRDHVRGPIIEGTTSKIEKYYSLEPFTKDLNTILCIAQQHEIPIIVSKLCLRVVQDLNLAKTEDERLLYLAEFIQDMMALHAFPDCNNRTLVGLLLNEMLFDMGYTPVVLAQPNVFDGFTPKSLVTHIKHGQHLFKQIVTGEVCLPKGMAEYNHDLVSIALDSEEPHIIALATSVQSLQREDLEPIITARRIHNKNGLNRYYRRIDISDRQFFSRLAAQIFVTTNHDKIPAVASKILPVFRVQPYSGLFLLNLLLLARNYPQKTINPVKDWCLHELSMRDYSGHVRQLLHIALETCTTKALASVLRDKISPMLIECLERSANEYFQPDRDSKEIDEVYSTNILITPSFLLSLIDRYSTHIKSDYKDNLHMFSQFVANKYHRRNSKCYHPKLNDMFAQLALLVEIRSFNFYLIIASTRALRDEFNSAVATDFLMTFIKAIPTRKAIKILEENFSVFAGLFTEMDNKYDLLLRVIYQLAHVHTVGEDDSFENKNGISFVSMMTNLVKTHFVAPQQDVLIQQLG
ncbi:MAG TPA: hypothetical protein VLG38_03820, partial [Gammaproteobacteria bacterium]|nr:hypothetical protein [Gammaproteobacteria bacterium]